MSNTYGKVTLRGLRSRRAPLELPLDQVYVPLTAMVSPLVTAPKWSPQGRRQAAAASELEQAAATESQRIELNRLLGLGQRLAVIGGPGCGKTTVLQHIAWALASALLADAPELAQTKVGLELTAGEALPVPIFVPISTYARHRQEHRHNPETIGLSAFVGRYLEEVKEYVCGQVSGSHETDRALVQHIAFYLHQRGKDQGREIDEDGLRALLAPTRYAPHTDALIQRTCERGGLLEERQRRYRHSDTDSRRHADLSRQPPPTQPAPCVRAMRICPTVTILGRRRRRNGASTTAGSRRGGMCTGWMRMGIGWRVKVCRWGGGW